MRAIFLLGVVFILSSFLVSALDVPGLSVPGEVDLSIEDFLVNITFVLNSMNVTATHELFLDGSHYNYVVLNQEIIITDVGTHTLKLCAYEGNETQCSSLKTVSVINGTPPVIKSVSYVYGAPIYGDVEMSTEVCTVVIDDVRSVSSINFSYWASHDDYYNDDFEDIVYGVCEKISTADNLQTFGCEVNLSSKYQAGFYDVKIVADNGFESVSKTFENRITIYNLISVAIENPTIDFEDVYNEWVDTDDPIIIKNEGNVRFDELGVHAKDIECNKHTFSLSDIMLSVKDNRGSAEEASDFNLFDLNIKRFEWEELYMFIFNPDEEDPNGCEIDWNIEVKYTSGEVP